MKFEGKDVVVDNPARCSHCSRPVRSLLVKDAQGGRRWYTAEHLPHGLVRHDCDEAPRRAA